MSIEADQEFVAGMVLSQLDSGVFKLVEAAGNTLTVELPGLAGHRYELTVVRTRPAEWQPTHPFNGVGDPE